MGALRWIPAVLGLVLAVTIAVRAEAAELDPERLVFVTGAESARIVAIDGDTDAIVRTYEVPGVPRRSLIARASRMVVTVTAEHPGQVHFLDIPSGRLVRSLDLGFDVTALQLAEDGETIAAAGPGRIAVIDAGTGAVEWGRPVPLTPSAILFDKKGGYLLAGDAERARVHRIALGDAAAGMASLPAAGAEGVVHIARTPGGGTGMAVDGRGAVTMIDLKSWRVAATLSLPGRQARIFPTVNSQYFLLPNLGTRTLSIVSTWTRQESERLKLGGDVATLNTLLADTVLFAFDPRNAAATVFDLDRRQRLADIALPGKPGATVTGPGGLKVYIALSDRDAVAVIDVRSLKVSKTVEKIGFVPAGIMTGGGLSFCH